MARTRYVRKLKELRQNVIDMGALTMQSVEDVLTALEMSDSALAERVIANDDEINNFDRKIEAQCMTLLALEQPMAKDLRLIATSLKMITDLERIGDFVVDIAEEVIAMAKPIRIPVSASKFNELVGDVKSMVVDSVETLSTTIDFTSPTSSLNFDAETGIRMGLAIAMTSSAMSTTKSPMRSKSVIIFNEVAINRRSFAIGCSSARSVIHCASIFRSKLFISSSLAITRSARAESLISSAVSTSSTDCIVSAPMSITFCRNSFNFLT